MKYEEGLFSHGRGWKVPRINPSTGKREILIISPYWIATNRASITKLNNLQEEAGMGPLGWLDQDGWSDAEVVECPVYYENENGDIVEYPSGKVTK